MKAVSKFKNVYGEAWKTHFEDINPADLTTEGRLIDVNTHFLGVSWRSTGGGSVSIIKANTPYRVEQDQKHIVGHQAPVYDLKFSPFQTNLLATCSDDATVRIWEIEKEGLTQNLTQETQKYSGHSKRVTLCAWNTSVHEVIASASNDFSVHVWNIVNGAKLWDFAANDNINSLDWSPNGALIGATSKDKLLHILDPRSIADNSRLSVQAHEGIKTSKMVWVGQESVVSTGFTKKNERQIKLWDIRNFTKEVSAAIMDNASGVIYPYFDADTSILYCPGRGEGNIKYYEVRDGAINYFNNYSSTVPQKSIAFFPKRAMNIFQSEEARAAKLTNNTIEYVSFRVPKRNEGFHSECYVDVLTGEVGQSLDDWLKGENKEAPRKPIDKIESSWSVMETKFEKVVEAKAVAPEEEIKQLREELQRKDDLIHELQKENNGLREQVTHTEEKLNKALEELVGLKGEQADPEPHD